MKRTLLLTALALMVPAILPNFGSAAQKMEHVKEAGFLGDYSQLAPGEADEGALIYIKEGVDFKLYDKVMIDPVEAWYSPHVTYQGVEPDQLKELTDYFRAALVKAVESGYPVVDRPGPGVLRLRVAITDVIPAKPGTGTHPSIGQTALEAELLDSRTNDRLGAVVDRRAGTKSLFKDKWTDATGALDFWAERFRLRLDRWHGIK